MEFWQWAALIMLASGWTFFLAVAHALVLKRVFKKGFITRLEFDNAVSGMASKLDDQREYMRKATHNNNDNMDSIMKKLNVLMAFEDAKNPTLAATMKGKA